jgi:hypothetical protein
MEKSSNSWIIHDLLYKTFCYADTWVIQCRSFGGSSVMVRWGIPERGRTPLVVDGNLTGLAVKLFSAMLFRSSKLRPITPHSSMKTLDHMLRVLYETAWHSKMLMASGFTRSFTHWASGMKWNDSYVICKISHWRYRKWIRHWSVSGTKSHKNFLTHWLDQCVSVAKPAWSMQMVDTYATDFVNVQKILVL